MVPVSTWTKETIAFPDAVFIVGISPKGYDNGMPKDGAENHHTVSLNASLRLVDDFPFLSTP